MLFWSCIRHGVCRVYFQLDWGKQRQVGLMGKIYESFIIWSVPQRLEEIQINCTEITERERDECKKRGRERWNERLSQEATHLPMLCSLKWSCQINRDSTLNAHVCFNSVWFAWDRPGFWCEWNGKDLWGPITEQTHTLTNMTFHSWGDAWSLHESTCISAISHEEECCWSEYLRSHDLATDRMLIFRLTASLWM